MSYSNRGSGSRSGSPPGPPVADISALLRPPAARYQYFTGNAQTPRPDIVGDDAEQCAKSLADLPASQLRRFYGAVISIKQQLNQDKDRAIADDEIRTRLGLLKAQAAYTYKRGKDYPAELVSFFTRHADAVRTREDFLRGFCRHFEAVVAYHRVFEKKRNAE